MTCPLSRESPSSFGTTSLVRALEWQGLIEGLPIRLRVASPTLTLAFEVQAVATPDIIDLPLHRIADGVIEGRWKALDVVQASLDRTRRLDPKIRAFLHLEDESIWRQARIVDEKRRRGERLGPLAGVPVAIKDSLCTLDAPTTCASRILLNDGEAWRSPYEATAVSRVREADGVVFGKTNLDEFGMGSSTEQSAFVPTRNPWSLDHVPGGSSGGSAAAVAARMVPAALGSDTGGSLRQPASFTSTVGIKPTYGRVSRSGLVAYVSSLDQVGPIASDVRGAARLLSAIAGPDMRDSTTRREPMAPLEDACGRSVRGLRVGVPEEYFDTGLCPSVERCVREAIAALASEGCEIRSVRLPHTSLAVAAYYVLATAEACSNLARFDGLRFGARAVPGDSVQSIAAIRGQGFGREVRRRILLGTYVLSAGYFDAYYLRAQKARAQVTADFDRVFEQVDVLASPASPGPPWRLGEKQDEPLAMYLADAYTVPASLAGLPAMTVPCGFTEEALPVGLQLTAPKWRENILCQVAFAWESTGKIVAPRREVTS